MARYNMLIPCHQMTFRVSLFFLVIFTGSCAQLPDYAQPHLQQNAGPLPLNVITYRALTRADFQAKELPSHLQSHEKRLNAHTAVSIRPVSTSRYLISSAPYHNQNLYYGRVEKLSFEAVMIPEDSWWNPHLLKVRKAYVLQHEQIHFALMEIAARRLNAQVARKYATLTFFGSSYEAVRKELIEKVNELMTESRKEVLKEHTAFDEDTSMRYAQQVQQGWWELVEGQLQELAGHK